MLSISDLSPRPPRPILLGAFGQIITLATLAHYSSSVCRSPSNGHPAHLAFGLQNSLPTFTSNEGQPTKTPSFSHSRPPCSGLLCARWHYHLLNSTLGSSSAIEHRVSSIQNPASHSLLTIHYSSITTFSHLLLGGIDIYQPPPIQQRTANRQKCLMKMRSAVLTGSQSYVY